MNSAFKNLSLAFGLLFGLASFYAVPVLADEDHGNQEDHVPGPGLNPQDFAQLFSPLTDQVMFQAEVGISETRLAQLAAQFDATLVPVPENIKKFGFRTLKLNQNNAEQVASQLSAEAD